MARALPKFVFDDDGDELAGDRAPDVQLESTEGARGVEALCALREACVRALSEGQGDDSKDARTSNGKEKRLSARDGKTNARSRSVSEDTRAGFGTRGKHARAEGRESARGGRKSASADERRVISTVRSNAIGDDVSRTDKARLSRELAGGIKIADHRRLIYRWTNALIRAVGLRVPSGSGSLFSRESKNKREKFDKFLLHYYGEESFMTGKYWYANANAAQFFVEVFRIATSGRVNCDEYDIWEIFEKKDPDRKASSWVISSAALLKLNILNAELYSMYSGDARIENGWPRGRPLHVPPPSLLPVTKSHSTYFQAVQDYGKRVAHVDEVLALRDDRDHHPSASLHDYLDGNVADLSMFKRPNSEQRQESLSLSQKKAIALAIVVAPSFDLAPTSIMKPLFSESLEGMGPPATPCERNNVNRYFSAFVSGEVIEAGDLTAAFIIRGLAVAALEPFKEFTAAYFKVKAVKEEVSKLLVNKNSLAATVNGLKSAMEVISERNCAMDHDFTLLNAGMKTQIDLLRPKLADIDDQLVLAVQREENARHELLKVEVAARGPYLEVVRKCYELNAVVQDRMRKLLTAALTQARGQVESQKALLAFRFPSANNAANTKELHDSLQKATTHFEKLTIMLSKLEECEKATDFALSTLETVWKRFSI